MGSRYSRMLDAIAKGEQITDEPQCRIEIFLKALANKEGVSDLPTPLCREEEYYRSIIAGEQITAEPTCKREIILKAIANNESLPEDLITNSREAILLKKVHETGVSGGGNGGGDTGEGGDSSYTSVNYVSNGIFYIRDAFSATLAEALILR